MKQWLGYLGLLVVGMGIPSCGTTATTEKPMTEEEKEFGPTGIPSFLRANEPAPTATVTPGGNSRRNPAGLKHTPIEDIMFTKDAADSDQLAELSELLAAPKPKIWEESDTVARRRSTLEGKPLLIWFTNSKFSPNCKALESELFARPDFGTWANEKLVRLKVDVGFQCTDMSLSMDERKERETEVKHYNAALKKRYRVMGHPTLVLLNPSGEVLGRWSGYKNGTADFTWGLLKHGEGISTRNYQAWRAGLEKKGYRDWKDRVDRKVFAKLIAYEKGDLILIDPDGSRFRTNENKLCDADQKWIEEQKQARHLP